MKGNIFTIIQIDVLSITPKYLQIVNSIIKGLKEGTLEQDDVLPSINELSYEYDISRDTAEKAYKQLKQIGILGSVPGKGYFIKSTEAQQEFKILLMFNKLSAHKKILYDSFVDTLGGAAAIDFYVYNNDYNLFKKILSQNLTSGYTHFVIIPHFNEGGDGVKEILNKVPKGKLILLDKTICGLEGEHASVFENFEKDLYTSLEKAHPKLEKYQTLKLIFPEHAY